MESAQLRSRNATLLSFWFNGLLLILPVCFVERDTAYWILEQITTALFKNRIRKTILLHWSRLEITAIPKRNSDFLRTQSMPPKTSSMFCAKRCSILNISADTDRIKNDFTSVKTAWNKCQSWSIHSLNQEYWKFGISYLNISVFVDSDWIPWVCQ